MLCATASLGPGHSSEVLAATRLLGNGQGSGVQMLYRKGHELGACQDRDMSKSMSLDFVAV